MKRFGSQGRKRAPRAAWRGALDPVHDCDACPRLCAYRASFRLAEPDWHNAPVPTVGSHRARLLIVGLAPGLKGANRTGRAFTGDDSGAVLHEALTVHGFARRPVDPAASLRDGAPLVDCRITNAVRCVPPANKPTPAEIATCRPYLTATIAAMPRLRAILVLGRVAHESTLRALSLAPSRYPFSHGGTHGIASKITLFDSFHCSRYNMNTGRLTSQMFAAVFERIRAELPQKV